MWADEYYVLSLYRLCNALPDVREECVTLVKVPKKKAGIIAHSEYVTTVQWLRSQCVLFEGGNRRI